MRHRSAQALLPLSVVMALLLGGCSLIQGLLNGKKGEPASGPDATPPPGYAPIYVQRNGTFSPDAKDAAIQVTRVDATNPTSIKVYAHIVDSNGTYLSGAANGNWRSWWCGIEDEIAGKKTTVTDFTLREVTEAERQSYALALVMDHSGSMGEARARAVQDAAEDLIAKKEGEDALAFVKYDGSVLVEVPLTTSAATLRSGLRKSGLSGFGGMTAIGNGIQAGISQVASAGNASRKAVIIFTDGLDNSSTVSRDSVIAMARRDGVVICAVDFGENTNPDYLKAVAEETGGSYYKIYQTSEFDLVFEDIYRRLRNYYLIEFSPKTYGLHTIRMKLCLERDSLETVALYDNTPDAGTVALLNVYFDVGKAELKPESTPAIENVLSLMNAYPGLRIELRGHTDSTNSTGDPDFNRKLSQRRADAVKDALVGRGISGERIGAIGFGESQPVADNATPEGRAKNRRTEFVILQR